MEKLIALAAAAMFAAGSAYAAVPTASFKGAEKAHVTIPGKKPLLDQTSGGLGIGIVAQNFESTYAAYDSAGADSFTVPAGKTWTVKSVVLVGAYFNGSGPATSENVAFYKDKKGKPGKVIAACNYSNVKGKDSAGTFTIALPKGCVLKAGTYWIAAAANLAFSAGGEWGWNDATDTGKYQADWENPGDGFGTGCTSWTAEATCIPDGQANGKAFQLYGAAK